ncbi:hypothetical protein CPB84DRAFT_1786336 [Gymnopilus junonius]|uniref:Uncharacterized protein n=1 Tax=Gymnopilus junonius TaxID=109634 RepID=A0A9P5TL44_GYMJU|nr:hypothetical protein CPB84DRAFT_1786336 [Gymnopilus junonius]
MDRIMWQPGWVSTPPEQFQTHLRKAMDQEPERGWVADGNYERRSGSLAFEEATDIIWLDPPLALYFPSAHMAYLPAPSWFARTLQPRML